MTDTSMIERVARVIRERDVEWHVAQNPSVDPDKIRRAAEHDLDGNYECLARAAIEAMREPTDLMGNGLPRDYRPGSHSATQLWKAMIDKALES